MCGKFKILAQIVLGLIVGSVLYFHPSVKVRDYNTVFVYKINENNKIDWSNPIKEYSVTKAIYLGKGEVKGDQFNSHETRS